MSHYKSCSYINKNKEMLINDYKILKSVNKVAQKHHKDPKLVSKNFKAWGFEIRQDGCQYSKGYTLNDNFLENLGSLQYWFIGLMASDGFIQKDRSIGISQSGCKGLELITYINKILDRENFYSVTELENGNPSYRITFSSTKILDRLKKFNIVSNKTLIYELPEEIPKEYFKDFLRGYLEGDGCISFMKNYNNEYYLYVSIVGTKKFINEVQKKLQIKGKYRQHSSKTIYELRWFGENAIKFCDWLFSTPDLYLSYKYYNYLKGKQVYSNSKKMYYENKKQEAILKLQEKKLNMKEISKELDVSYAVICKWAKELK